MKKISTIAAFLFLSLVSFGQSNKEDVDLIQAMYGKDKKELVNLYMVIPGNKKKGFWSLYDQYETERKTYGKARIALIEAYANVYDSLGDKKAIELMNKKIALYNSFNSLQKKYLDKMVPIIGGRGAAKFIQLEDYLENNIRLAIQDEIPFIDELEKTKVKQ